MSEKLNCLSFNIVTNYDYNNKVNVLFTATNKNGLIGWKSTDCTNPLDLANGNCDCLIDIWWMRTDRLAPSGITVAA